MALRQLILFEEPKLFVLIRKVVVRIANDRERNPEIIMVDCTKRRYYKS